MSASLRAAGIALLALAASSLAGPPDWVGKELPAPTVQYLGGAKPELKGKPAAVEFWATWCAPCRKSVPHLNELNEKYKAKGLTIIGISDEEAADVEEFQKAMPVEYMLAVDKERKYQEKLGVEGIPQAFLLDKSGKVVWEGHPMELDEEKIEEVLK